MIAFAWLFERSGEINSQELYAANFEQFDISGLQRSGGEENIILMEQLYKEGKYSEALPLLESQLASDTIKDAESLLATGITHLELDAPQKALSYFKQITEIGDFNFKNEVSWYSALAYLKSNNLESTKKELQPLVQDITADHHEEAKKLLKAITK